MIGHFAKNCPQSRRSIQLLTEIEEYVDIKDNDLESVLSLEDEPSEDTLFSMDVYEEHGHDHFQISKAEEKINSIINVQLNVYPSKWDKPIQVIAFMDTGAASSLMNPTVLPDDQWVPHFKNFNIASNGILTTTVITKHPITIEFFLGLKFRTKLLMYCSP